jgi:propionyl-CoA carboxylase alpha chain
VVRVDTGIYEGSEVSMYYDPMIAKLITYGATRDRAIAHMRDALNEFFIRGVAHNISFLAALMVHTRFMTGRISTNMIAEEYPNGFHAADVPHDDPALLISVSAFLHRRYMDRAARISGQLLGHERKITNDWVVLMSGKQHPVHVDPAEGGYDVVYMGENYQVRSDWQFGHPLFKGTLNGTDICIQVERRDMIYRLFHWGSQADVMVLSPRIADLQALMPVKAPPDLSKYLLSPMPGLLTKIAVQVGQEVKAGEELAVIEAMKMENVLRADQDAKVAKIMAAAGDSLAVDQAIIEFE